MLRRISMAALCVLLLSIAAACQSRADWDGVYTFSEKLGEDPGGAAMLVEYRLELAGDKCTLNVTGYQSDSHIRCTLDASDGKAVIRFQSYDNGDVKNRYGVQVYQVGESLFTLRGSPTGLQGPITEWGGLVPDSVEEKSGNYFARQ